MHTQDIDYRDEAVNLRGYLAWDGTTAERRPGVLVFHEGLGLGEFAMARARMLAELAGGRYVRRPSAGTRPAGGPQTGR